MRISNRLIWLGFLLVLVGAVLPFLMVIDVVPSTLLLSFVSYGSSIVGVFLGFLGAASIAVERRRRDRE